MNHLIPLPASLLPTQLEFQLGPDTQILVAPATPETLRVSEFLAAALRRATDYALPIVPDPPAHARDQIFLTLHDDSTLGAEGYELNLTPDGVFLRAQTPAGLFYGIQTLLQLGAPSPAQKPQTWRAATGSIRDVPRFAWRGAMLDVARHFFSVQDVKRYIDWLAAYKLNRLHLHLSDDQGWRIEIKTWDKLATIGGSGGVGGKKSGYYTQDEYRELVAYAAERFIVIVPEIDTPGHTNAALAAYPELNCDGVARELYTGIEVGFSSLCLDKEITYQFLEDVIRELAALTPGEFIHIGGDEAHATDKTAYTQFIARVETIVEKYGKRMMGWEEIGQAKISARAVAQLWRGEYGAQAIQQGAQVILSPGKHAYLDMQYNEQSPLGLHWAGYVEAQDAYAWDPATLSADIGESNILGVEAALWSETLLTFDDITFMAFPRLTAIAEIAWSPQAARNWESYRQRVAAHGARWQALGLHFYRSPQIDWE